MAVPARTCPPSAAAAAPKRSPTLSGQPSLGELAVPLAVLAIVIAMITPLPPFLLDILISANITHVGDRTDGLAVHHQAGGVQRLSHHAAADDAVPAGAQHFLGAPDSAQRQHREPRRPAK